MNPLDLPRKPGVYQIACAPSGKKYVGSSANIKRRVLEHLSSLRLGKHHSPHLQRAWDKYGHTAFEASVIEILVSPLECLAREQFWLDTYKAADARHGYNCLPFAASRRGYKLSPETRARMAAGRTGKKHTAETRARMSVVQKALVREYSPERLARMSAAQRGKTPSFETLKKQSAVQTGKRHSPEARMRMSIAQKARTRTYSEETLARMSASHVGRTASAETRVKMSAAQKARRVAERAASL